MIKWNILKYQTNSKIHMMLDVIIFFETFKCHLPPEYCCLDIFEIWNKNGY